MVQLLVRCCTGGWIDCLFWISAEYRGRNTSVQGIPSIKLDFKLFNCVLWGLKWYRTLIFAASFDSRVTFIGSQCSFETLRKLTRLSNTGKEVFSTKAAVNLRRFLRGRFTFYQKHGSFLLSFPATHKPSFHLKFRGLLAHLWIVQARNSLKPERVGYLGPCRCSTCG